MIFQESTAPFTPKKKLLPINSGSPQSSFDFPIFLNCLFAHFFVHARIIGIVKFCIENRKPLCLCSSCQRHRPAIKDSFNIPTHPLSPITTYGDLVSGPAPKLIELGKSSIRPLTNHPSSEKETFREHTQNNPSCDLETLLSASPQ